MGYVREERRGIATAMLHVGPDAPTLCGEWTVRDLAAHLVLRERRPDAAPGILVPPLAGYTDRVQRRYARRDFAELVEMVRTGPPWYSPFRPVDEKANLVEYVVHHEDVRRAQDDWQPRRLPDGLRRALFRPAALLGRRAYAGAPVPVRLESTDGRSARVTGGRSARGGGDAVTVRGEPEELLLHAFGRDAVQLDFEGPADAARAVRTMRRTLP